MTRRPAPPGRAGYTLLELLTVIVIIGILVGLLLPVIRQVRVASNRGQTANEINQLTAAVDAFKIDWGAAPPTYFRIPIVKDSNDASFVFLAKKYPRWAANIADGGATLLANGGSEFMGNQSMVYFLGGPELTGWAHDAPVAPSASSNARMTYLEITPDKLKAGNAFGYQNDRPVYIDPFGIPYMYWGSNREVGRYNNPAQSITLNGTTFTPIFESSPPNRFLNEKTCQIISAGADKKFGPGGAWQPGVGKYDPKLSLSDPLYPPDGPVGADDIANFNNGSELGKTP